MFREMRRKRQLLPPEETEALLHRGSHGVLAVSGDDGYPYAVPLSYAYHDGKLWFHGAKSGHKLDAIRACDKASFCVVDRDEVISDEFTTCFRSAIAFGRVRVVTEKDKLDEAIYLLAKKYSPDASDESIRAAIAREYAGLCMFALEIEHLTGKEAVELTRARQS